MDKREEFLARMSSEHEEVEDVLRSVTKEPLAEEWVRHLDRNPSRGKVVAIVCLIFLITPLVISLYHSFVKGKLFNDFYSQMTDYSYQTNIIQKKEKSLSEKEVIILKGDSSASSEIERWNALHDLQPTSPQYFINYAAAKIKEQGGLDAEDWDFINTHDPNNGIYETLLVRGYSDEIIKKIPSKIHWKSNDPTPAPQRKYEILDQVRYEESLANLKKAYQRGECKSYFKELNEVRNSIIGESKSYTENIYRISIIAAQQSHVTQYLKCVEIIDVALQEAEVDWAEIEELWELSQWLITEQLDSTFTLVDSLVARACIHSAANAFWYATKNHPNTELRTKAETLFRKSEEYRLISRDETRYVARGAKFQELLSKRADLLSLLSIPAVGKAIITPIAHEEHRLIAGQRMEQAFIMGNIISPLILIIIGIISIVVFSLRNTSRPILDSLINKIGISAPKKKCFIVILLSSFPPILALLLARYGLSFGALDYGIKESLVFGAPHHYNVFWFMLLAVVYSPFCLGGIASPLGKNHWHQSLLLGLIYIGLFTAFLAIPTEEGKIWAFINIGILGVVLLSLLGKVIWSFASSLQSKVILRGKLHIVLPSYTLSVFLIWGLSFCFKAEERHWAAQDHVFNSPHGGFTYYEDLVTQEAVKECRELMK